MNDNLFILTKTNKVIIDERGDETFYDYYYIKLNENLKMLLKNVSIKIEYKNKIKKYEFSAIPNFNSCQGYFIKPIKINNNLEFIDEMRALKDVSNNGERINRYYFYEDEQEKDIDAILSSLGYQYYKNKLVLGVFTSESGISEFKPLINKKLRIPSKFKSVLEEIELNSWRINILLKLPDSFKNEGGVNYKGNLGIKSFLFNSFIDKLIDLHLLYKKDGWVYDIYRLFNFDDDRNRYFIYEAMKLPEINNDTLKPILEKVKIDLQIRREEFEKFYSDLLNYYISHRYEEFIQNEEALKPILLKVLGIDYK
jgi:hypothetical protein